MILIAIMLSLFSCSLCRHAECQWDVCRSKTQSWHLHCRCMKTLMEVIMVFFSPPVRFAPQMNCETLHAFQFSDTTDAPTAPRILVQNGTQSVSNKTAFHGALQINWVWLIGCFFSLSQNGFHSFISHLVRWLAGGPEFCWSKSFTAEWSPEGVSVASLEGLKTASKH